MIGIAQPQAQTALTIGRTLLLSAVGVGFGAIGTSAQLPPTVSGIRLSADTIEIGDRFDLGLQVTVEGDEVLFFPDSIIGRGFAPFGPVEWSASPTPSGGQMLEVTYPMIAFAVGPVSVPEFAIFAADRSESVRTGSASEADLVGSWGSFRESPSAVGGARFAPVAQQDLWVASVLMLDEVTSGSVVPRPAADVSGSNRNWPATIFIGVFGALLLGTITISTRDWLAYTRETPESTETTTSPKDAALSALDDLFTSGVHREGRIRDFYERTSEIVRRYVEHFESRWTPSWTSTELMKGLNRRASQRGKSVDEPTRALLEEMHSAEIVKFAGERPSPEQGEAHWQSLRDWVEGSESEP